MSSEENLANVRAIYDAYGRADVETVLSLVTDDVDWAAEAVGDGAPWYGERRGKQGVGAFFADIGSNVDVTEFTPLSFAAAGDDVHVLLQWAFTVRSTGRSAAMQMQHFWRLRDGKVAYFRGSEDSAQTVAAFSA
jgi:uncharacterized protein